MYYNTEATIYDYKQKLTEYRETLGIMPTDVPELLARIIIKPENDSEMKLSQDCLRFLYENTTFVSETENSLRKNHAKLTNWCDNFNGIIYGHISDYESLKNKYQTLTEAFPEIIIKMKEAISERLLKALTEPKNIDDAFLCQKYKDYLYYQTMFVKGKAKYMDELKKRQTTIDKLKEIGTHPQLLEILLDPKTDTELKFCISYFKLQDSITTIEEEAKEGKSKPSSTADLVRIVSPNLFTPENYIDKQRDNNVLADLLYSMVIAEKADNENLMTSLVGKYPFTQPEIIILAYQEFARYGQENIVKGISRENPKQNDAIERFCSIQEEFTKLTKKGNFYNPGPQKPPKKYSKLPSWVIS